jgi:hypothetical protein
MTGRTGGRTILRYRNYRFSISTFMGVLMRSVIRFTVVAAGLLTAQIAVAQAAPAGSTGICKDGTYTSAANKSGACRGHQGIKEWYASAAPAAAAAPAMTSKPAPAAAPAPAPAPAPKATSATKTSPAARAAAMPQAAGGGSGMVWVNTSSNVYHCYGSDYYGKTKAGAYMSEADAKAKGAHADHGKACSK